MFYMGIADLINMLLQSTLAIAAALDLVKRIPLWQGVMSAYCFKCDEKYRLNELLCNALASASWFPATVFANLLGFERLLCMCKFTHVLDGCFGRVIC